MLKFSLRQLAAQVDLQPRTVRSYIERGLLPGPETPGRYAHYGRLHLDRLKAIKVYREIQGDLHSGAILPIGDEPSGRSWTGFQSIKGQEGYLLVFREQNDIATKNINTYLPPETEIKLTLILGEGTSQSVSTDEESRIELTLPKPHSYALYRYE